MIRVDRNFRPARWLRGPFRQTVASAFLPVPEAKHLARTTRQEVCVSEGERLGVLMTPPRGSVRGRLLLLHGLAGSAMSRYMLRTTLAALARGWEVARLNFRGAEVGRPGGKTFHNAGRSGDVEAALRQIRWSRESEETPLTAVGFSLGGAVLLKHLTEAGTRARDRILGGGPAAAPRLFEARGDAGDPGDSGGHAGVSAAAAISPPIDLAASLGEIEEPRNRLYHLYYVARMRRQIRAKVAAHPRDLPPLRRDIASIRAIDEVYTAPDAEYASPEAYYAGASSLPRLSSLGVPTLLLTSRDDPFIPAGLFENLRLAQECSRVVLTDAGGHVGYLENSRRGIGLSFWAAEAVLDWMESELLR